MTEQKTRHVPNYKLRFVLLIIAALLCILISFSVGRFPVSLADVIMVFATEIFKLDIAWDFATWSTVINIRLPRILAAFFVGAALATAGAAYQGMFQNPLVSPDILGASSGAGFGAALAIFMNLGPVWITAFAFAGAVICVGAAYAVSRFTKGSATLSMVLAGILVSRLFTAMTSFLKTVADTEDQLPEITYWLMGSLAGAEIGDAIFAGVLIIAGIIPIFLLRWRMNVLTLGEDEAKSMGINPHRLRFVVVACATLITAAAV
ncbi:MAG TPA: iron ABC transporter permease, partial [Methanocorpusculum sp.]|nr:iron ABC transporter permease [Methanocorpusculum sp.]